MIKLTRTNALALLGLVGLLIAVALIFWRPFGSSFPSQSKQNQADVAQGARGVSQSGTATPSAPPPERSVSFPDDISVGQVRIRDWGSKDRWKTLGEAQGNVTIPAGKEVMLNMNSSPLTDFSFLSEFGPRDIQQLSLFVSQITDADLRHRKGLELHYLGLSRTQITDAGLAQIKDLLTLDYLDLNATQVTDLGMQYIEGLKGLTGLNIPATQVTRAGVARLRRALPDCDIVRGAYPTPATPTPAPSGPVS